MLFLVFLFATFVPVQPMWSLKLFEWPVRTATLFLPTRKFAFSRIGASLREPRSLASLPESFTTRVREHINSRAILWTEAMGSLTCKGEKIYCLFYRRVAVGVGRKRSIFFCLNKADNSSAVQGNPNPAMLPLRRGAIMTKTNAPFRLQLLPIWLRKTEELKERNSILKQAPFIHWLCGAAAVTSIFSRRIQFECRALDLRLGETNYTSW